GCAAQCSAVFKAVCLGPGVPGAGNCATVTPGGPTPTPTNTPITSVTNTPTSRTGTVTPTGSVQPTRASGGGGDDDSCNCTIPSASHRRRGAVVWLSVLVALAVARRRAKG